METKKLILICVLIAVFSGFVEASSLCELENSCFAFTWQSDTYTGAGAFTRLVEITNNCNRGFSYAAFGLELDDDSVPINYNSGLDDYYVEISTNNLFYSIKFECDSKDCYKDGEKAWFTYTINSQDLIYPFSVQAKAGQNIGLVTFDDDDCVLNPCENNQLPVLDFTEFSGQLGEVVTINWNFNDPDNILYGFEPVVYLYYSIDDWNTYNLISTVPAGDGSYNFDTSEISALEIVGIGFDGCGASDPGGFNPNDPNVDLLRLGSVPIPEFTFVGVVLIIILASVGYIFLTVKKRD